MATNEILYTDRQDIVVTPSTFQVKGMNYMLLGITKHGMAVIRPVRLPGIIILALGIAMAAMGYSNIVPSSIFGDVEINGKLISSNTMFMWIGLGFVAIGALLIAVVKERYAVRIATAEGEKNAVVSNKREYINQIINALNRAFMVLDVKKSHMNKTLFL